MDPAGAIVVLMRWLHLLAAVTLLGSAFSYLAIQGPRDGPATGPPATRAQDARFRELVDIAFVVFLLTGAILTFDRLSSGRASILYAALLGLKIALAFVMFHLLYRARRSSLASAPQRLRAPLALGCFILLLAVALKAIFEASA